MQAFTRKTLSAVKKYKKCGIGKYTLNIPERYLT